MLTWLRNLLFRLLGGGAQLDELERWRARWLETRQFLAEFPDAANALDFVAVTAAPDVMVVPASFDDCIWLYDLRERMRARRNTAAPDAAAQVLERGSMVHVTITADDLPPPPFPPLDLMRFGGDQAPDTGERRRAADVPPRLQAALDDMGAHITRTRLDCSTRCTYECLAMQVEAARA